MDTIGITGLRAPTRIGVPDEERTDWQTVALDVKMEATNRFTGLDDEIEGTIDYFAVSKKLREVAAARPRKLIETLANDLAAAVLEGWPVARVEITVRKFILPDTDHVAVCIERGPAVK